jgi:O-antigen/teichoic acid export membrane protein
VSELRTIWRHGRVYASGNLLNRLASFLLIPVLLRTLSPEEWGVYVLLLLVGQVVAVVPAAVADTTLRLYFDHPEEKTRGRVISTAALVHLAIAIAVAAVAFSCAGLLANLVFGHRDYGTALFLAIASWSFEALLVMELMYFRLLKRSDRVVYATLTRSLSQLGLCIFFVVALRMGLNGLMLGYTLAAALVSIPALVLVFRETGTTFSTPVARELLGLGLPLVPAWLARSLFHLAPAYALNVLGSMSLVGIFSLASKLVEQLRLTLITPFATIWGVSLLEVAEQPERAREFNRVFLYFTFPLMMAVLGLSLYAPELVRLLAASEFGRASAVMPLLAFSYALHPVYYHFQMCIIESKRPRYLVLVNWLALGFAAVAFGLLIPRLGITGAAIGELASGVFRLALAAWLAARCSVQSRLFPWRGVATLMGLAAACHLLFSAVVGAEMSVRNLFLKAACLAVFGLLGYLAPVFTREERREIRGRIAARLCGTHRTAQSGQPPERGTPGPR